MYMYMNKRVENGAIENLCIIITCIKGTAVPKERTNGRTKRLAVRYWLFSSSPYTLQQVRGGSACQPMAQPVVLLEGADTLRVRTARPAG